MAGKTVLPWLLAALSCGLAASGHGASPVSADVQPLTMRPRNQAPWFVNVELRSKSHALLEGTLEIDGWSGRKLLFHQQTPDMELAPGVTRQRLLLPAASWDGEATEEVQLRFSTATGTYDLGRFPTTTPSFTARQYAIGICREETSRSATGVAVWQALRPERLDNNRLRTRPLTSSPIWFSPEDFPTALGLCAFDVVMVEGNALAALTPRQLHDLTVWVEAGGSLLVVVPERLDGEHTDFLNHLAGSHAEPTLIGRNVDGTVIRPSIVQTTALQDNSLLFRRVGLGRCAIAFDVPADEDRLMTKPEWFSIVRFLAHMNTGEGGSLQWRSNESALSAVIQQRLVQSLPRTMRMIPLPVLSGILGAFVVLVGPGEWFVLGRLRRRRWTWITFPVLAVTCAFLTVRAAEYYLGRSDQGATMVITDFTGEGRPLRENRFELQLSGGSRASVSEIHDALCVSCPNVNSGTPASGVSSMGYPRGGLTSLPTVTGGGAGPPLYRGRLPGHYTLSCGLTQWTLYFQRSLKFGSAAPAASLHWAAVHWEHAPNDRSKVVHWVQESIGARGWNVSVWRDGRRIESPSVDAAARLGYRNRYNNEPVDLASMLVVKWPQGSVPISPSGQAELNDMALNYTHWDRVVVAEREVGNEIQVQRCLYPDNE
jgi:hypothetical protein